MKNEIYKVLDKYFELIDEGELEKIDPYFDDCFFQGDEEIKLKLLDEFENDEWADRDFISRYCEEHYKKFNEAFEV